MCKDCRLGLVSAVCLFATGCFSYGPYGHPGTLAPPNTAMVPQPYGTAQIPPGAVWIPASPNGTSTLTAPNPISDSAPTSFDGDHEPATGKTVPEPTDPGKAQPSESTEPFGLNDDEKLDRTVITASQRSRPKPLVDEEFANVPNSSELELAERDVPVIADDEPRLPRSSVNSAEFRTRVRANAVTPVSATSDRFGYDSEGYSWLKGIIEFDSKNKVWHLTYSQAPNDNDQFGGEVTLKNPQHFKTLRSGQAVSVAGQFDPNQRDRLGKPVYEVSEIVPAEMR